jgi:hypothetical protein
MAMSSIIEQYRENRLRQSVEVYFNSRLYYVITITITLVAVAMSYSVRLQNAKIEALETCYNQSQIIPYCYDEPQCYNQTTLQECFGNAGYYGPSAQGIASMRETFRGEWIT